MSDPAAVTAVSNAGSNAATVHVGIVTYNSAADLPACFAALHQQTYPRLHIVVLDNASHDPSVDWVRQHHPTCDLLTNPENIGYGRAHNQIIRHCHLQPGDFYLPLNPDVTLAPDYVERLLRALLEHDAGWASGKLLQKDRDNQPTGLIYSAGQGIRRDGFVINVGQHMPDQPQFNLSREVFLVSGAAPLIRQELIVSIAKDGDLFDSSMFMYAEDIDMGWRASLQGWRCWYAPEAVAYHRGGTLRGKLRSQAFGNVILAAIKNASTVDLLFYDLPLYILNWGAHTLLSPRSGFEVARQLLRDAPTAWKKRRPSRRARAEMLRWFRWSAQQPTGQPVTLRDRLRVFLKGR